MSTTLHRVRRYFISSQVYEALRPLFFLTFLYGLTPFHVVRRKMGESYVKMSCFGIFNIFVYIVLCGFCYISSLRQGESIVGYFFRTEISTIGDRLQIFNGLIAGAVIYASAILKRCKLLRTLTILHSLDMNFANIGIRVKYSRIFRYSILLLVCKLLILGVYFVGVFQLLVSLGVTPSFCVCITFFLQHSVVSIAICLFCIIAFSFERRMSIINQPSLDMAKDDTVDVEIELGTVRESPLRSRVRRFLSAKQLYESLRPLFHVTYLLGLTSFYVGCDSDSGRLDIKKSWFGYANGSVHIGLYAVCYILTIRNNFESIASYFFRSRITYFGDMLQIVSGFIGVTVIYLTAIIPKHRLEQCLQKFHTMDLQLHSVGIKIMYSNVLRFCYADMIFMFLVNIIFSCGTFAGLYLSEVYPTVPLHFTFIVQHTVIAIAVTMFTCFTYLTEMRLVMVNKVLKNLAHQWDTRSIKAVQKQRSLQCLDSFSMYTIVTKDPVEIIQESMEIHHLICEAAATANKYFTYQLLTIISIAFLIIVFDAYYVLETLLGKSKRESKFKTVEFVTFFSCQMILYLIAIISIVEGSNRAIKKSEKTGPIVHSLLNKAKSAEVRRKLQQFSMQLMHLKINFTAAGLFNIDRSLYFTISGALTTYLIILLQFTTSSPSNENGNGFDCCETFQNLTNRTI
ncbi:putative gustatory receptor 28b [Drosophila grimshawi]|uniref:putative gustatory receptor 28b n=1 Tax=Drosophila grimshawi TaxID=7222 RepID=UPI000C86EA09|nr:putative gustatory receptor 28b [Drosophila grimshawi]